MKVVRVLLASFLLLSLLPGCWNRKEINELAIQVGTAIDKVGSQYRVAVQVVVPAEVSSRAAGSGRSPVTIYEATATTIFEAFRKLTETSPREIYSAHIRVLVLGEALAREGIIDVLDALSRNPEARSDFYIMIARKSEGKDVLKILTTLEKIPAENLFHTLDTSSKTWSPTTSVTLDQLIEQLVTKSSSPVLTGAKIIGNQHGGMTIKNVEEAESAAMVRFIGLAVFKEDKLEGWLNEKESRGYNYIMNNVKTSAGHIKCPSGGSAVMETTHTKTKLKGKIVDGEPVIRIELKNMGTISDVECRLDLKDPHMISELEERSRNHLIEVMDEAIHASKNRFHRDIFGFGQVLYRYYPDAWEKMKDNWSAHFNKLKVEYAVDSIIQKIGTTNDSLRKYLKE
ncbi:Ger(x)C family spore germination protein [Paenibacillus sp. GCM10012307]|uniref:Ger(X)C family spore germination protein n=1 Tax=Paenibacillus roseus TaxID=2798579 RepID=A0A934MLX7_9BACL|nr:Ger(x)C family spore germination protein [Paenibacillus roseus]MBJ6362695.1 Ger(x)C family spore germination protein [Paenibacillus roseus]